jgi:hypothetical protein
MAAPYVSSRRLVDNSISAMLAAVEIYNKPRMTYRDEVVVISIVNAWELALKAALRKANLTIYYQKRRGERYRSVTLDDALGRISAHGLWPKELDGPGITANLKALSEYRDRAIHLYNARGLGAVLYPFLQQNVLNFRDFVFTVFRKDIADSITWQLLPLGATAPADSVKFMRVDKDSAMLDEVAQFIADVRGYMDQAELAGSNMSRVATVYDIHLQSVKKMTSADLVVAVSSDADGRIVLKKTDPNLTHPLSTSELLKKVNQTRNGRKLTTHDYQAVCWREDLRTNPRYAWKHGNSASCVWSADAVKHLADLSDEYYEEVRKEYRSHLRGLRDA